MTQKEILLEQMASCRNQTNWFITSQTAVEDLTPGQALQKDESNNSIMQIVIHLIFWNELYLSRFNGTNLPPFEGNNKETFEPGSIGNTELNWDSAKERLDKVLSDFYDAVKDADEEKLNSQAIQSQPDAWYSYIAQITIHNAYHIGQIVTIRKQHGNWNPDKGFK
ncbi:MAG: DinB family protein [Ignavibacteriae bacterium]|nr:MAG: DinB family protein [Ignavibacteriota bacterium]